MRWKTAIGKPPSLGIDITVANINKLLAEVNAEAMVQLHGRSKETNETVQRIEQQNEELQTKNDQLLQELTELKKENHMLRLAFDQRNEQEDEERLEKLKASLDIKQPCDEMDLSKSRTALDEAFPFAPAAGLGQSWKHSGQPSCYFEQMTDERLNSEPAYQTWLGSTTSSLLYISGKTAYDGRTKRETTYSWLSPATVVATDDHEASFSKSTLDGELRRLCIYYNCHPDIRPSGLRQHGTMKLLGSLLWRVLQWQPALQRRWMEHVEQTAQTTKELTKNGDTKVAIRRMVEMIRQLLVEIQKERGRNGASVCIIIDRLDQCDVKMRYVMDAFEDLVSREECNVKIFVVADDALEEDSWEPKLDTTRSSSRVICHSHWDQGRIPSYKLR